MAARITDKERLEWLFTHQGRPQEYKGEWWVQASESQEVGALPITSDPTRNGPRAAIDAAIRAERKKPHAKKPGDPPYCYHGERFGQDGCRMKPKREPGRKGR